MKMFLALSVCVNMALLSLPKSAFAHSGNLPVIERITIKSDGNLHLDEKNIPVINVDDSDFQSIEDFENATQQRLVDLSNPSGLQNIQSTNVGEWVEQGRQMATEILASAYRKETYSNWERIYSRIYSNLKTSRIHWPNPGYDYNHCGADTLAFAYVGYNQIYLCRRVIREKWIQTKELAQLLIHEGAHTIGYSSECDATRAEVYAMRTSGVGLAFKNGYFDNCNI